MNLLKERRRSPQLHQEVGANRPGFPSPTISPTCIASATKRELLRRRPPLRLTRSICDLSLRTSVSRYPLSMGSSTSSAISHPAARSASSEKKLSGRGKLLPQPEPELGLPIFARAKFGSPDNALRAYQPLPTGWLSTP
jgi:hypothetical protein